MDTTQLLAPESIAPIPFKSRTWNSFFIIELVLKASFLNKKRIHDMLDKIPEYSIVEIIGSDSVYIDNDILEIFSDFKSKAHQKHIQLTLKNIPEVETIELH